LEASKSIHTDGGAYWYNEEACKWLRLNHIIYGTQFKNIMERIIQQIKNRTECLDANFPYKMIECERKHVNNWLTISLISVYGNR
jgi:hypothetical protein